ncbi:MAG: ATP-binding protein [Cyanophyceae cyanobacterium]
MQHSSSSQLGQQIVQLVLASTAPERLLSEIAARLGKFFQADFSVIVTTVAIADASLSLDSAGEPPNALIGFWYGNDTVKLSRAALLKQCLIAQDLVAAEPFASVDVEQVPFLHELPVKELLQIVTCYQGAINGAIFLGFSEPQRWSREEQLMQTIAESVAIAVASLNFHQQTQIQSRYRSLFKIFSQTHTSANADAQLDVALEAIAIALQVDWGCIWQLKHRDPLKSRSELQGTAEAIAQWSGSIDYEAPSSVPLAAPLFQKVWQQAPQPLALTERAALETQSPSIVAAEASALLAVPIISAQKPDLSAPAILGFVVLQQQQPRVWQRDEIELVEWAAAQSGTAVTYHQTLNRVQSLVEERTAQLRLSLEVQAKLSEKMRQQISKLQRLNQVKDEFIANLSDSLKHPLTKMKMAIQMLKLASDEEQRQRYLEILERECAKEIGLVNDLLTLHHLEANRSSLYAQKLDLKELIAEFAHSFEQEWSEKGLALSVDYTNFDDSKSILMSIDPESLRRILHELLTNASKFSAADTVIHLTITRQEQNQMVFQITNTGAGISTEEQTFIFDKFQRGKNASQGSEQGTGLGLALVKSLVHNLNGTIEVCSCPCEDSEMSITSFTVILPRFQGA